MDIGCLYIDDKFEKAVCAYMVVDKARTMEMTEEKFYDLVVVNVLGYRYVALINSSLDDS